MIQNHRHATHSQDEISSQAEILEPLHHRSASRDLLSIFKRRSRSESQVEIRVEGPSIAQTMLQTEIQAKMDQLGIVLFKSELEYLRSHCLNADAALEYYFAHQDKFLADRPVMVLERAFCLLSDKPIHEFLFKVSIRYTLYLYISISE